MMTVEEENWKIFPRMIVKNLKIGFKLFSRFY